MISFININGSEPYNKFCSYYKKAELSQNNIDAVCISSFDTLKSEVNSRIVNLKYIKNDEWIFFSNYHSPKALQFDMHDQISANFFWPSINCQIRIKAKIYKTSNKFSDKHYASRVNEKNIVAHVSDQSNKIGSYEEFLEKIKNKSSVNKYIGRPEYWGGFSFIPYYFEFWEGHNSRINKRCVYEFCDNEWKKFFLQP